MTVSIGSTLPGSFGNKSVVQAGADNGDSTFQDLLGDNNNGHAGSKRAASHPHRSRDNALHRLLVESEHHNEPVGKEEAVDETNGKEPHRFLLASGKTDRSGDNKTHKTMEKQGETTPGNTVQERLPLLMSLQEINRASGLNDTSDTGNYITDEDGMPVSRRTAQPAISDADPELPEKKPAKADGPRNIEAQQTASKIAFPATVTAEPISVAQTTTSSGAGKPDTLASLAEATQSNTAATLDEPAARPQIHERVTVTSAQSFPAPVTPGLDPTTSRLVTAIASDMGAQQTPSTATLTPATAHQAPVAAHTLKIELHPAELGVVNAHLRLTGEQLSIELLPDTQEAYRRLSSDGDTIARALRDLGFDVGKITVLQPSIAAAPAPRTDAGGSATALPNRDSSSFQSGQSGSNGNGSGGHHSGRSNDNDAQSSARSASTVRSRTDSGLVI